MKNHRLEQGSGMNSRKPLLIPNEMNSKQEHEATTPKIK